MCGSEGNHFVENGNVCDLCFRDLVQGKEEDYMIAFAARCSKHPKYKAKLKPTTGCQACEFLFKVAQQKEMNTTYPDGSSVEWERLKEEKED
jgi:hypothetical protein